MSTPDLSISRRVDALEVRWPSGQRQVFEDVAQGRVHLVEGATTLQR